MRILIFVLLLTGTTIAADQKYACKIPTSARTTVWGHNHALIDFSAKPVERLRGSVRTLSEQSIGDVLVEVIDLRVAAGPAQSSEDLRTRQRIGTCITGPTGRFEFDVPPGRYELIASKPDWNSTSVLVVVERGRGKRGEIVIPLRVGD